MKQPMFLHGKRLVVDANFGTKMGTSPYLLCGHENPRLKEDIIEIFFASTIEAAIKYAVLFDFFNDNGYINLITGDGQIVRLTLDPEVSTLIED
ncbi:hypothetical protein KAU33_09165 [Candidatus Dependentiae bacterium]|nr:hypothetical protein [Candidatus Dependentiae bacterium]